MSTELRLWAIWSQSHVVSSIFVEYFSNIKVLFYCLSILKMNVKQSGKNLNIFCCFLTERSFIFFFVGKVEKKKSCYNSLVKIIKAIKNSKMQSSYFEIKKMMLMFDFL